MSGPPRFPPLPPQDWPAALDDLRDGFAGRLDVYRTMAHHPDLLRAWAPLREHVVARPSLGPERSEVVILRTGRNLGSAYEWGHHVSRARALGMDDARIAAMRGPLSGMCPEDATLCRAVDELFADKRLSEDTQAALLALVGPPGLFDVIATVGFYSVLGYMVNSFDTPLDAAVASELEAAPLDPPD
ncbi:carboxymuconolactone decarboxylase family protein [Pseudoponticoccus marisrubri]|uniref:Carboxymuconolactone decarboxylase n=1 Tax=Pseudoponticoccus marisrubri TaxID=1685382 RepID=A0A0W7WL67_9RHOB|nr:carboxymuconolactone decarboxylase family protein [Pseudoponticoccus marisrubri]KUF11360.1 carboxymuconolactone decarboxylase [Pseudoponticoccus marisrubri]